MSLVLGLDGGLASVGWAVVDVHPARQVRVVDAGVLHTRKSDRKTHVRASDDNLRRARELAQQLGDLSQGLDGGVGLICAETMSFPRSSSVACKLGMFWGVVAALSLGLHAPVAQASPQEIKYATCGRRNASKEAVQHAMWSAYGYYWRGKKADAEHVFDAIAAVHACLPSDIAVAALRGGA